LTNAVKNPDRLRHFITDARSNLPKSVQSPEGILSSVRNVNSQQLAAVGVVAAEVLGFFTIGTMIGRLKIVGYHGEVHHEH
jgi:F-type H+-transporting ATPase subunit g